MKVGDDLHPDDPNNLCFGCGHHNPHGLLLKIIYVGGHSPEAKCEAPAYMCGAPNAVHGGIQATLIDEARILDAAANVLTTSQARWLRLESS
jgi:hypothetical protein